MSQLVLTTFDWTPEIPRGYVRDLCGRRGPEEAGLPYRVGSVPFRATARPSFAQAHVDRMAHFTVMRRA